MAFWDSYAAGQDAANRNLMAPIQRQSALEALQSTKQQNALGAINLNKQNMTYQDMLATRSDMAGAQPTQAAVQPQAPLPSSNIAALSTTPAAPSPTAQAQMGPPAPTQAQSDIAGLSTNVAQNPGLAALSGSDKRLASMQATEAATPPPAEPPAQAQPGQQGVLPQPQVQATQTAATPEEAQAPAPAPVATGSNGEVTPADRIGAAIKGAYARGDMATAETLKKQAFDNSKAVVDATGNPNEGLKVLNAALGTNYQYMKMANNEFLKDGEGNIVAAVNVTGLNMDVSAGMPYSQALAKNSTATSFGAGKSQIVESWLAKNSDLSPVDQIKGLYTVAAENNVSLKSLEPVITNLQKAATQKDADARQQAGFEHAESMQRTSQAHTDKLFAQRLQSSQGSASDLANAAQMLAEGKLDLSKDLSRISGGDRLALIAQAKQINPSFDPRLSGAQNASLGSLVKTRGAIAANEIDANKNFDQLTALHAKLGNGLIPAVNLAMNYIKDGTGAPEPGTAAGVAYEALTQYARVINKTTGGAAVTDSARKEANALLPVLKLNNAQFEQRIAQYRVTMRNTIASQDQAINQVRSGTAPLQPNTPQGPDTSRPVTKGGITGYRQSDGSVLDASGKRLN